MRLAIILSILVLMSASRASAMSEAPTCKLNLESNAGGGLYSGTLVDSHGNPVGTCVGFPSFSFLIVSGGVPTFCRAAGSFLDCPQGETLGELHYQALRAVLGNRVRVRPMPTDSATMPAVAAVVARLGPWLQTSPLFEGHSSASDVSALTLQITDRFQAAGLVGPDGRFSRDAMQSPSNVLPYLQQKGVISPNLAIVLRRLFLESASCDQYRKALLHQQWQGQDRLAVAIVFDMMSSSERYFGAQRYDPVRSEPYGLARSRGPTTAWDVVGALLTWELGPGSLVGGYVMSAASCWCLDF